MRPLSSPAFGVAVFVLAMAASGADAQGEPPGPAAEPRAGGALTPLARGVVARVLTLLGDIEAGDDVAVAVGSALPPEAPRADALVRAVSSELRGELRGSGRFAAIASMRAGDDPAEMATQAARSGYRWLLVSMLSVSGRELRVATSAFRSAARGFGATLSPAPLRLGSVESRARLDAHLRHYVGALPAVTERTVVARSVALPSNGYVTMAVADLDHDGRGELLLVKPGRVDVVRVVRRRRDTWDVELVARMPIDAVAPPASRSRRPVGTSAVEDGRIAFRSSDGAVPFVVHLRDGRLAWSASESGPCVEDTYPLQDGCATRVVGRDYFHAALAARRGGTAPPRSPAGFYARQALHIRQEDGSDLFFEAIVTPRGRIAARAGEARGGAAGYGAALAMADLDDDGLPELLVSSSAPVGAPDHLALLRVRQDGAVVSVWSSGEMAGSVWIAGAGDLDGDGGPELLAVEEPARGAPPRALLWIVR